MPLLVYIVVGCYAFVTANGAAAEKVPAEAAAWLRSATVSAAFAWTGVVLAVIYPIAVRWPNRFLAAPAALFKSVTVSMIGPMLDSLLRGGSGRALLILSPIVFVSAKARRVESARRKEDFLSSLLTEAASKPLLGGLVGAPVFVLATMLAHIQVVGLLRSVPLIVAGIAIGILVVSGIQQRDEEWGKKLAAIDGAVIGGVVGYFSSVNPSKSLPGAVILGIVFGVLAGLFAPGIGIAIGSIIGYRFEIASEETLGNPVKDRVNESFNSTLGRLVNGVAAFLNRKFGGVIVRAVEVFAVLGGVLGLAILISGREPVSFIEYNQAAVFPDGCPKACEGKKFQLPFALLGQNMYRANLTDSDLSGSKVWRSTFWYAQAKGVSFQNAILEGTDFSDADLRSADFSRALLANADFRGADLEGADLSHAFFKGANLRTSNLKDVNLSGAIFDDKTVWPAGFDPIQAGASRIPVYGFPAARPDPSEVVPHTPRQPDRREVRKRKG
jgi:Pentapeptide repeats (8 copies)